MLLFPFYWMTITALKPNDELTNFNDYNPFWPVEPDAPAHPLSPVRDLLSGLAAQHHAVAVGATILSLVASVFAAYAIERLRFPGSRWTGLAIFLAYLVPPSILFIPLAVMVFKLRHLRHAVCARSSPIRPS